MVRRCAYRIPGSWGLGGQCKTQLAAERPLCTHAPIIFCLSGRSWDHISIRTPHNAQFLSTYRSVRLHNSFTCMGNRTDFCTSDRHLGITHGRKTVSPSRNPCDSDPFLVAIHNRCRLHGTHTDIFFSGRSSNGSASMGTDLLFAFLSTAEHRLTRAILERHHARATSELSG